MIILKNTSKINPANNTSKSIRTSIPSSIAQILEVEAGDSLEWIVDVTDNSLTVTVEKAK